MKKIVIFCTFIGAVHAVGSAMQADKPAKPTLKQTLERGKATRHIVVSPINGSLERTHSLRREHSRGNLMKRVWRWATGGNSPVSPMPAASRSPSPQRRVHKPAPCTAVIDASDATFTNPPQLRVITPEPHVKKPMPIKAFLVDDAAETAKPTINIPENPAHPTADSMVSSESAGSSDQSLSETAASLGSVTASDQVPARIATPLPGPREAFEPDSHTRSQRPVPFSPSSSRADSDDEPTTQSDDSKQGRASISAVQLHTASEAEVKQKREDNEFRLASTTMQVARTVFYVIFCSSGFTHDNMHMSLNEQRTDLTVHIDSLPRSLTRQQTRTIALGIKDILRETCKINTMPDDILATPQPLRVFFNLSNITDLEEIPAWLSYDQEGMSGLDFSHTSLASLNMQRIPRSLQTLNLTDCKLTKLPTEIVELKKLDYILLDNNPALVTTFEQEAFLAQKMRGYERTMRP